MKEYQGEKAIISLTSWKARINTVGKTIFSLIKECPGFHIVLVLSEEEFPKKEKELPEDLLLLSKYFEILWVYKNYKAFKKVLFTMDKYRDVPVISADDDCYYTRNYAEELYNEWIKSKQSCVSYYATYENGFLITGGYATLYPPYYFGECSMILNASDKKTEAIIQLYEDDLLYACLRKKLNKTDVVNLNKRLREITKIHDEAEPLHNHYANMKYKMHLKNMWAILNEGN